MDLLVEVMKGHPHDQDLRRRGAGSGSSEGGGGEASTMAAQARPRALRRGVRPEFRARHRHHVRDPARGAPHPQRGDELARAAGVPHRGVAFQGPCRRRSRPRDAPEVERALRPALLRAPRPQAPRRRPGEPLVPLPMGLPRIEYRGVRLAPGRPRRALRHRVWTSSRARRLASSGPRARGRPPSSISRCVSWIRLGGGGPSPGRVSLRDVLQPDIFSRVALVPQEAFLFSQTVSENIAYGRPGRAAEARSRRRRSAPGSTTRSSR
jgi:hypothetical protein